MVETRFRYSPERRTALVLCGTGAHGAYHAGVLRALHEAGVKIDVMAGQGVGAAAAALAAVDGAPRLWDEKGPWRSIARGGLYPWKSALRIAAWLAGGAAVSLAGATAAAFTTLGAVLSWWLLLIAAALGGAVVAVLLAGPLLHGRTAVRRRARGGRWWHLLGAPLDAEPARLVFAGALWELLRGGSPIEHPSQALGRRYADVLAESLGQPGFRELMLVATDLDSRRDVVAALLTEPYRQAFTAPRTGEERSAEVLDLAGSGRAHVLDMVLAALTPPVACDPFLLTFDTDGYWRGETHRLCDRPGATTRLLEELAAAGVSQVIIVSAAVAPAAPHRLAAARLEPRHRLGEFLAAAEAASLRDARDIARLRFDSVFVISPAHNSIGPFDLAGAYDEASDRWTDVVELMDRASEDAYRQFIEPVVGASGEQLAHAQLLNANDPR